jgi:hypothetical protein
MTAWPRPGNLKLRPGGLDAGGDQVCRNRREAAVEGWCSVEELTRWGFEHSQVVMANEAHNGMTRCIRTRDVGIRIVRAAHQAGVRRLAMEALRERGADSPGPIRVIPAPGGYLAQPDMRRLITTALDLGWSLWAYDIRLEGKPDPAELLSREFTNRRELEQARNLCQVLGVAPAEPLLVWCGNGHATKEAIDDWVPMGWHFQALSGTDPFVIDQTPTVAFEGQPQPWAQALLAELSETVAAHGGTAGILRDQAPPPLDTFPGVDGVIISTENALT